MKRYLILAVLLLAAALGILGKAYRSAVDDRNRLARNQSTLLDSVTHYKTAAGKEAASVQALELKVSELEWYKAAAAAEIRALGIKLRRVESVATTATRTEIQIAAPLTDTVVVRQCDTVRVGDTVRLFRWCDTWCRVAGAFCPIRSFVRSRASIRCAKSFIGCRVGSCLSVGARKLSGRR